MPQGAWVRVRCWGALRGVSVVQLGSNEPSWLARDRESAAPDEPPCRLAGTSIEGCSSNTTLASVAACISQLSRRREQLTANHPNAAPVSRNSRSALQVLTRKRCAYREVQGGNHANGYCRRTEIFTNPGSQSERGWPRVEVSMTVSVNTLADLRGLPLGSTDDSVYVLGRDTIGDGGGGMWRKTVGSTADDGSLTIPNWTRDWASLDIDVRWFGAKPDANYQGQTFSTLSATLSNGSPNVTVASTASLYIGSTVTGTGIPASTTIRAITNATTFTLSGPDGLAINATAGGAQTLTIGIWGMFKDAGLVTPATDNKLAFQNAYRAFLQYSTVAYQNSAPNVIAYGYQVRTKKLRFTGGYFIDNAVDVFSRGLVSFAGARGHGIVEGDGKLVSRLYVRQKNPSATDYAFRIDMPQGTFRELGIFGVTGQEQFFDYANGADSQDVELARVGMNGFKVAFAVSGTVNCDKSVWNNCQAGSATPGASLFLNTTNTQSVGHVWKGGNYNMSGFGAAHFRMNAGGAMSVQGGSWEMHRGACLARLEGSGATLGGQLNPNIVFSNIKFEVHDNSYYAYLSSGNLRFENCGGNTLPADAGNPKWYIEGLSSVVWDGGSLDGKIAFGVIDAASYFYAMKPHFYVTGRTTFSAEDWSSDAPAWFDTPLTPLAGFGAAGTNAPYSGNNHAGRGRLIVDASNHAGDFTANEVASINGAPYAWLGWSDTSVHAQVASLRASAWSGAGLPPPGTIASIKIPLNCVFRRVAIHKTGDSQAGGAALSWTLKDLDGVELARLSVTTNGEVKSVVNNVAHIASTTNKRSLVLAADPSNGNYYAQGYAEIEWL